MVGRRTSRIAEQELNRCRNTDYVEKRDRVEFGHAMLSSGCIVVLQVGCGMTQQLSYPKRFLHAVAFSECRFR